MPHKTPINPVSFCALLGKWDIPEPLAEHRFDGGRRWRFDYAWPEQKVALEVDGAIWAKGRHSRPAGILAEHEKFNRACVLGWRILRTTPQELCTTKTAITIHEALYGPAK